MATMTYQQWLAARTRRAGHTVGSSPAEAAAFRNWQAQQPGAQQTAGPSDPNNVADPAAGGDSTAVDPNDLWNAILKDPTALDQAAAAQRDYTTTGANDLANWQNTKDQLAAQIPQLQNQLELGTRQAVAQGAARGTYASGQTELDKQQQQTGYTNALGQNQLQSQAADTAYQTNAGTNAANFNNQYYGAFKDAANRYAWDRLANFKDTYGITSGQGAQVPTTASTTPPVTLGPTTPKPPTPPKPTWAQFVASHGTPTGADRTTLATKYKTRFA